MVRICSSVMPSQRGLCLAGLGHRAGGAIVSAGSTEDLRSRALFLQQRLDSVLVLGREPSGVFCYFVRKCAHLSRVFVTQCGICGASAQDRRLAIFDLRFKLSLHGADSGACSPASSSSALASSRVCLGRSRGLAAGAQAAHAARYMGRKTCWGSETGYYYLRHATHRLALPQSAHRVAVALSACIAVVSSR